MTRLYNRHKAVIYFILIAFAAGMLMPFIWMISTSLKSADETFRFPPSFVPNPPIWQNYIDTIKLAPFHLFYLNSIIVTSCVTLGQLLTCAMGAYAFARLNFKGRDKLFLLYLATIMIPFQATMIPVFIIIKNLGWIDSHLGLIIPNLFSAYGTFLLRQFFKSLPRELEESVRIDGGGYFVCFTRIILPLSKPALATFATFVFIWCWNYFLWPLLVLNTLNKFTLPLGISFFQGQNRIQWNYMMCAATITLAPLTVVYLFTQKYFIEGITLSGIKG